MKVYRPVPGGQGASAGTLLADRVQRGPIRVMGFLNNDLDPGLARGLADQLELLLPDAKLVRWLKANNGAPEPDSRITEILGGVDAAVVGVGMCGSCTASVLMDAIRLWKAGIPTVAVVWDSFERTARAHIGLHGVDDLPIVVVERLELGQTEVDQEAKAPGAAGRIHNLWEEHRSDAAQPAAR